MTTIGMVRNLPGLVFSTKALLLSFALLLLVMGPIGSPAWAQTSSAVTAPNIEIVEDEEVGIFTRLTEFLIDFQRRANVEISTHMKANERGDDLGAFLLGLAIAFAYGVVHALGPGHGKFVIMSYFMGREVRIGRGMIMAVQVAVVHVIAADAHSDSGPFGPNMRQGVDAVAAHVGEERAWVLARDNPLRILTDQPISALQTEPIGGTRSIPGARR